MKGLNPPLLHTRYPIVALALGLAAFRPSASREQRYLAYNVQPPFRKVRGVFKNPDKPEQTRTKGRDCLKISDFEGRPK